MQNYQHYINGEWSDASDGAVLATINPATEEVWAQVPVATEDEVNRAVAAAEKARFGGPWGSMTATQRGKLIHRLADLIVDKADHLGDIETIDS